MRSSSGTTALIERSGVMETSFPGHARYDWMETSGELGMENVVNLERADISMELAKVRIGYSTIQL